MILSKKIFYVLVFLLPLNLGKHFILGESIVKGLLIDYLIPTIYIQDLLVTLLIVVFLYEQFKYSIDFKGFIKNVRDIFFLKRFTVFYFFIFSLFLSSLMSLVPLISITSLIRLIIYFFLFIYVVNQIDISKELENIINTFVFSFTLVGLLGVFQFLLKGSVFDNYLILGEQPYSFSTIGIVKENLFGFSVLPSYGLFRHPNIFGGMLCMVLLMNVYQVVIYGLKKVYLYATLPILFLSLLLTFSYSAVFVFILGLLMLFINHYFFNYKKHALQISGVLSFFFFLFLLISIFSPTLVSSIFKKDIDVSPSVYRRNYLNEASLNMIKDNIFYGVGISEFTLSLERYVTYINDIRFVQPVHNVFTLVLAETGIISFIFFILILILSFIYILVKRDVFEKSLLFTLLFGIIILFSLDHYFWTIHQPLLFLWIILGLCWTKDHEY